MNRHLSHLALPLAGALALACGGSQTPTASDEAPSLNVVHDTLVVGFIGGDFHYTVFVGISLEDLIHHCSNPGRPGFNLPTWDELMVNRPNGSIKELLKAKQVDITVFDSPYFPIFADECDPLSSHHYTGAGAAHSTENDQTFTHPGALAATSQVRGTVTGEDGQVYRLLWTTHQVQTVEGGDHPAKFIDRIKLTPVPR
jgi:hypothetical protein